MLILSGDFSVIQPDFGIFFWTSLLFLLVWFVLGKVAFKPISKALRDREASIDNALQAAENARQEMASLSAKNEDLLKQAREERSIILKEAKDTKDRIVREAQDKAKEEATKIITSAKIEIENQKIAAITEMKNQAGLLALDIAEKVIRKELKSDEAQQSFVASLVNEIKLN